MDSWPPSPNNTSLMKSVHVGQLGLFFVCNRMFMKMIQDRYSSSYANLWDFNSKPLISAASDKEGFFWSLSAERVWISFPDANDVFAVIMQKRSWLPFLFASSPMLLAHTPSTTQKPSRTELFLLSLSVCHCCILQPRVCSLLLLLISFPFSSLTCHAS